MAAVPIRQLKNICIFYGLTSGHALNFVEATIDLKRVCDLELMGVVS